MTPLERFLEQSKKLREEAYKDGSLTLMQEHSPGFFSLSDFAENACNTSETKDQMIQLMAEALGSIGKWCTRDTPEDPCTCVPHNTLAKVEKLAEESINAINR